MLGAPTMRVGQAERKADGFWGQDFPLKASSGYSPLRSENNRPCNVRLQPLRLAMGCNLCGYGNLNLVQIAPKPGIPGELGKEADCRSEERRVGKECRSRW